MLVLFLCVPREVVDWGYALLEISNSLNANPVQLDTVVKGNMCVHSIQNNIYLSLQCTTSYELCAHGPYFPSSFTAVLSLV